MDKIPERLKIATWYRSLYQKAEAWIWLPKINPSIYQVMAIFLAFIFLLSGSKVTRFTLMLIVILLDWLDGATARRYGMSSEMGYMIDVLIDRLSEAVMFFPLNGGIFSITWFVLALTNMALSFLSYKTGKHTILPLRFMYLFYIWI